MIYLSSHGLSGGATGLWDETRQSPTGSPSETRLTNLEPASDPELSSDGLELLFARDGAIMRSRRGTIDEVFPPAVEATELRVTDAALFGPTLSSDGLVVVFRTTPFDGVAHVFQAERTSSAEPFNTPHDLVQLSRSFELLSLDQFLAATPALGGNGRLLLAPDRKNLELLVFTRADPADDFVEAGSVAELAGVATPYFAPFLTRDGELYFTGHEVLSDSQEIFRAERE